MGGIRKLGGCARNVDRINVVPVSESSTSSNTPDVTEGSGTGVSNLSNSITVV